MEQAAGAQYLENALREFRALRTLADKALAQVNDEQFFVQPDPESNSLAVIVKHMAGNMRSRWTDFLNSDGEKPDRHRDREFEIAPEDSRGALAAAWEAGWQLMFAAVEPLAPEDLARTVRIRGRPLSVMAALNRQLTHYAYHVGQIVFLAKHLCGSGWQTLSVPRGQSEQFNQTMSGRP
ncbi:MAG: DUF1572 family protein [Gemmatimonadetes bacterium]|nr:DUF1572 family protein [Gemmatimonadota bacterium]